MIKFVLELIKSFIYEYCTNKELVLIPIEKDK